MARSNNGGQDYSEYEKIVIQDFWRVQNTPVYCKLCGGEILNVASADEEAKSNLSEERKQQVHMECLRKYRTEQAEKARREAEKRAQEIEAKRKAEDIKKKASGGK
jgi:hypothetical protein